MLEAMACGKAIVSTNVNGIPEALDDQENAFLVSPNDPAALAMCVNELLNSPRKLELLGTNAKQKVLNNFSSEVFIEKLHNLYRHEGS
jgi:glycosyltransferase involved in cell wall biosynthesis